MATTSGVGMHIETLMKAIPNAKPTDPSPNIASLCKRCQDAFTIAQTIYLAMCNAAITDSALTNTISLDTRHKTCKDTNYLSTYHGHKHGWIHQVRLYNHNRTEYTINASVTVIYKHRPHSTVCSYSQVLVEMARVRGSGDLYNYMYYRILEAAIKHARLFGGKGVTTLDRRIEKSLQVQTLITRLGEEAALTPIQGFERIRAWINTKPYIREDTPIPNSTTRFIELINEPEDNKDNKPVKDYETQPVETLQQSIQDPLFSINKYRVWKRRSTH